MTTSLELESRVRTAAREALGAGQPLDQLRADLARTLAAALGGERQLAQDALASVAGWVRDEWDLAGGPP